MVQDDKYLNLPSSQVVKINLKEPYQVEKKFSEALVKLGG